MNTVDNLCLHQLFEARVATSPDATAVVFEGETLSYQALNQRSNQLARYLQSKGAGSLQSKGVGSESLVGLCVERSIELVVGILAILKVGAAYVPIDPANPDERVQYILQDAKVSTVLTQSKFDEKLCDAGCDASCDLVILDDVGLTESLSLLNSDNLCAVHLSSNSLAYVIYTSGSTGAPKGVLVEHGNVVRLFKTSESLFGFDHNDCWTLFHSYAFDFSVWELWGALVYGGKLVVVPFDTSRSPEDFYQLLIKERVSVLNQTPSAFYMLSDHCQNVEGELPLRYVIFGGEALETRKLKSWFAKYDEQAIRLINMYGITETTVHVTYRQITRADCDNNASPIGKPLPDLTAYIVDDDRQLVPKGQVGELFVGGAGVTRGYLNQPQLTEQRFIAAPPAIDSDERLYRTGDLVKQTDNGELDYIGRCDFQVKIRGFRIELGEIEAQLEHHHRVKSAIVLLQQKDDGNEHLAAFVIKADASDQIKLAQVLTEHLSAQLPDYMVPAAFMVMDEFPLTTNGKIDRQAFPQAVAAQTEDYQGAQTPLQENILAIWQAVLKREKIGIKDNFFAIGGDSILSLKVISKLKKQGIIIKATDMYVHQSIEALALLVGVNNEQPVVEQSHQPFALIAQTDRENIDQDIIEDAYPLSYLQQGMIFHDLDSSKTNVYHTVASYQIEAPFEREAFTKTLAQLVQQHELLRTSVDLDNYSIPLQLVYRQATIPLTVDRTVDRTAIDCSQQQQAHYQRWLELELKNNFDWSQAPLIRVFVHVYQDNVFHMSWSMHHVVEDGWSESVLFTELVRRYKACLLGETPEVTQYKTRYRDFVAAELNACADVGQQQFWRDELAGFEPLKLAQGLVQNQQLDSVRYEDFQIDGAALQKLKLVGSIASVSQKTIFMAAHLKTLSILTCRDDVATGMVVHGRPDSEDSAKVFGCFLNTLVLRYALCDENWMTMLRNIDAKDKALFAQRYFPLLEICNVSGVKAPFDVLFNYVRFHDFDALEQSDGYFGRSGFANTTYPMDVNFIDGQSSVTVSLAFNTQVIDKAIAQAYISTISLILHQMADHLGHVHHRAHYVDEVSLEAYRQLNGQVCQYDDRRSLLQRFAECVAKQPAHTVLQAYDQQLSFGGLDQQSNQLARYLQSRGVTYQTSVAVCMDHCSGLLISILAILKLAAVYVPLDPTNPPERISYVLKDSGAKLLLTQSAYADAIDGFDIDSLQLDQFDYGQSAEPFDHGQQIDELALAYIIYTSGSTGTPKGVMVTHRGISYLLNAYREKLKLDSDTRMLQYTSIGFDISLSEVFGVLSTGGTLFAPSIAVKGEPQQLQSFINNNGITHSFLPQAMLPLLDPTQCPSLTFVVVGGERMALNSVKTWAEACHFYHAYGLTECTVDSSMHLVSCNDEVLSIGAPFAGCQYHILDRHKNPVPVGVVGELYVAGQGIATGYLNDAEKTAAVFVDSPFEQGQKLFKSGDLVRYHGKGNLEFVERIDNQVKLRGFRIELGEIEQQLSLNDGVASSVVVVREDTLGDKRLVAYILRDGRQHQNDGDFVAQLKLNLQQRLPHYMVPAVMLVVAAFELNRSGKINLKALPKPDALLSGDEYQAPQSDIEKALVSIWSDILKLQPDSLGLKANFFDAGGHSLLVMVLLSKIRDYFDVEISVKQLLDHGTIKAQAELIAHFDQQNSTKTCDLLKSLSTTDETLPTLYCLPGAASTSLSFVHLAKALSGKLNLLAFDYQGLGNNRSIDTQLDEMVDVYLSGILDKQTIGPYYIAGHSFGGVVAYQLVTKLQARGAKAKYIALDCHLFTLDIEGVQKPYEDAATIDRMVQQYHHLRTGDELLWQQTVDNIKAVFTSQLNMLQSFRAEQVLSEEILHLYTSESAAIMQQTGQFDKLADLTGARVHHGLVAGDHYTMLQPANVATIADKIETFLIDLTKG